jgi:hypothetical protein
MLNKSSLLSGIYEHWCKQMLRYSKQNDRKIIELFRDKFVYLAEKLALNQGFTEREIENCKIA